jgi:sarcosine oxidase subunit delta
MLLINCPWCGARAEIEFRCGGEAHIARPSDPGMLDDSAWAAYLFLRTNPRGLHAERWIHQHGCQRWFNAIRDTYTDAFVETYRAAERPSSDAGPAMLAARPRESA